MTKYRVGLFYSWVEEIEDEEGIDYKEKIQERLDKMNTRASNCLPPYTTYHNIFKLGEKK